MRKIISIVLSFGLLFQQSGLLYAAGEINLANYLSQARNAIVQPDVFQPPKLRYISYDINNNDFKLFLDKGDNVSPQGTVPEKDELFNYFLIGLALPNDTFWVNLRPDAPANIIDPLLEKTDIGKIFLEADLQLKKDTSSLTSPQNPEGKAYWDKLYKKAGELFGTENITIPTITRPWIVPNEVIVRETEDSAYIYKATLKVMLEADYLIGRGSSRTAPTPDQYAFSDPRLKELNEYSSQIIRETIIPKLTREINSSKRYAKLRQVYYSLVLSRWFKQKYGLGSRVSGLQSAGQNNSYVNLIDSGNLANLASQQPCDKQSYFQAYQKSFKDGEYNLKETVATPFGQSIRSYISGGLGMGFEYKAVNSPVVGLKVNSSPSPVTETLIGQPPATTASPLTVNDFEDAIIVLNDSKEYLPIDEIEQLIRLGVKLGPKVRNKNIKREAKEGIWEIVGAISDMDIFDFSDPYIFSGDRIITIEDFLYAIKSGLESKRVLVMGEFNRKKMKIMLDSGLLNPSKEEESKEFELSFERAVQAVTFQEGSKYIENFLRNKKDKETVWPLLMRTVSINRLLLLFYDYQEQQKSLEETIKDQASIVAGSDNINNIRFGGLRDREKVRVGVELILKKILEISQDETISYESLRSAQEVFIIASQEDKTYHYRQLIGSYIMPVFAEFLKKKSSVFEVKDMQVKIRMSLSNYIQRGVLDFLRTFIKQNRNDPYAKFIGKEKLLDTLSAELKQKTQEIISGKIDYDIKELSRIIKELRGLSEDAKLKTVEENVSLIKIITAGSPLTLEEVKEGILEILKKMGSLFSEGEVRGLDKLESKAGKVNSEAELRIYVQYLREWIVQHLQSYVIQKGKLNSENMEFEDLEKRLKNLSPEIRRIVEKSSKNLNSEIISRIGRESLRDFSTSDEEAELRIRRYKNYTEIAGYEDKIEGLKDYKKRVLDLISKMQKSSPAADSPLTSVSSAIGAQKDVLDPKRGGIDLTDRMLKIKLERVGSFASSALVLPEIANVEVLDLDKEYARIQAMVSSSIRPSDTRILEFAAACYYRGEFDQRLAQVSSCVKAAHLADEISGRDSSEALRLATMLPDALYGG